VQRCIAEAEAFKILFGVQGSVVSNEKIAEIAKWERERMIFAYASGASSVHGGNSNPYNTPCFENRFQRREVIENHASLFDLIKCEEENLNRGSSGRVSFGVDKRLQSQNMERVQQSEMAAMNEHCTRYSLNEVVRKKITSKQDALRSKNQHGDLRSNSE
jgi:hypothetical protein